MERRGREIADDVLRALAASRPLAGAPVGAARTVVWLDVVGEPRRNGRGTMDHREALARKAKVVPRFLVDRVLDAQYPFRTGLVTDDRGARVPLAVQVLRVGDLALCAHAAESFHGIGLAVKARSPAPLTLYAGYANGMIGYLPTREEVPRGGYEVDLVPYLYRLPGRLAADSGERAVEATLRLLEGLFGSGSATASAEPRDASASPG
jgi:hypothetical protein